MSTAILVSRMLRRHLYQANKNTCGQTCCAMIVNQSESAVIMKLGFGKTNAARLRAFLWANNVVMGPVQVTGSRLHGRQLPSPSLVRIRFNGNKRECHWAVFQDGVYLDPFHGPIVALPPGMKVTSFYQLSEKGPVTFNCHCAAAPVSEFTEDSRDALLVKGFGA